MAQVKEDLVKGSSARLTRDGWTATRVFRVWDISASTPSGRLIAAVEAVTQQSVPYGEVHPDCQDIYAEEFIPEPWAGRSRDGAAVHVIYRPPKYNDRVAATTFDGSAQAITTNYDADRKLIVVKYKPTDAADAQEVKSIGQMRGFKSTGVLTIEATVGFNPKSRLKFMNKINADVFLDQPKYCWWISNIWFQRAIGRPGYLLRITANYDEETFVQTDVYRNINGVIPSDINAGAALNRNIGQFNGYTNALVNGAENLTDLIRGIPVLF